MRSSTTGPSRYAGGAVFLVIGVMLLATWSAAAGTPEAGKARVKGYVTQGETRHALEGVAVLKEGPILVFLITDKAIPPGKARAWADNLLEGTGRVGIKMGLEPSGPKPDAKASAPLFVQFLPGDGSLQYDSGPNPRYEFQPEAVTPGRVAGRLHGTIVSSPKQVDVDVEFDTPVE